MSGVPAVVYPVGRTKALAVVLTALVASGWLLALYACFWPPALIPSAPAAIVSMVSCAAVSVGCWRFWRAQTARHLRWDGERWWLVEAGSELEGAPLQLRLDAQRWMLLWFRPLSARRAIWLWAEASTDPQRWQLLRCALYSPMTLAAQTDAPAADVERA
jgi:hypothetical protein